MAWRCGEQHWQLMQQNLLTQNAQTPHAQSGKLQFPHMPKVELLTVPAALTSPPNHLENSQRTHTCVCLYVCTTYVLHACKQFTYLKEVSSLEHWAPKVLLLRQVILGAHGTRNLGDNAWGRAVQESAIWEEPVRMP